MTIRLKSTTSRSICTRARPGRGDRFPESLLRSGRLGTEEIVVDLISVKSHSVVSWMSFSLSGEPLNWIRRLWRGDIRLVVAFWAFGVVGTGLTFALIKVCGAFYFIFLMMQLPNGPSPLAPVIFITLGLLLPIGYWTLVSVGVWRSAARYDGKKIWQQLARAAVVVNSLNITSVLVMSVFAFWHIYAAGYLGRR